MIHQQHSRFFYITTKPHTYYGICRFDCEPKKSKKKSKQFITLCPSPFKMKFTNSFFRIAAKCVPFQY